MAIDKKVALLCEGIKAIAEKLNFTFLMQENSNLITLKLNPYFSYDVNIIVEINQTEDKALPLVLIRTSSWSYQGERTDLHDIFSQLLATIFRTAKNDAISFTIWDDPNEWSGIHSELYSRWLVVGQPFSATISIDDRLVTLIESMLKGLNFFFYLMWLSNQNTKIIHSFEWKKCSAWAKKVAAVIGDDFNLSDITFNSRKPPGWTYYRSYDAGISVIKGTRFNKFLYKCLKAFSADGITEVSSVNGKIFCSESDVRNFVPSYLLNDITQKLNDLDNRIKQEFLVIPSENSIVVVSNYYTLFYQRDVSRKSFEIEREHLRRRHSLESRLLFSNAKIQWEKKIDDEQFELLIRDLLEREENVKWVRKVGHSRERDGGRDLIAEWTTVPLNDLEAKRFGALQISRKVLIQCKATSNGVGKSEILDIRDTIENYDAAGFFLATSSYLKGNLTSHLEKMREEKRYFIDWWTKPEIEERLKNYPDLVIKYPGVFLSSQS